MSTHRANAGPNPASRWRKPCLPSAQRSHGGFATATTAGYPWLDRDRTVDVAVLGGGGTGLTTALLLAHQGAQVAVIEADRVGGGVTANNTVKITALQSTVYSTVYSTPQRTHRRVAAPASQEGIDCELRHRPALTVAVNETELAGVQREAEAAANAGLPVKWTDAPHTALMSSASGVWRTLRAGTGT